MSRTLFCRPTYVHSADRVLSATAESGLMVGPATAASTNAGAMVLRTSGVPWTTLAASVALQTGGGPHPYAFASTGVPAGATARWKHTADTSTQWRGYHDVQGLVRVAHPIAYSAGHGIPGTPRQLPDGYLGIVISTAVGTQKFYRIASDWSSSSVTCDSTNLTAGERADFVVLPSGRLVCYAYESTSGYIYARYSDDYGLTWAALGQSNLSVGGSARIIFCAEVVGDSVVAVIASATGAIAAQIALSVDGGGSFTVTDSSTTLTNPRTAVLDGVCIVVDRPATALYAYRIAPGGGLSTGVATALYAYGNGCVVAHDNGTLWALGWENAAAGTLNSSMGMSADGGATWISTGASPFNMKKTGYATDGLDDLAGGMWLGAMIVVARTDSNAGSDAGLHFLQFGEWATLPAGPFGLATGTYADAYLAVDYPNNVGWTAATTGAGATITNQPFLRLVGTAGNGTRYYVNQSAHGTGTIWDRAAGDRIVTRWRVRVNTGGSLAADDIVLNEGIDDAVNTQEIKVRFTTTGARCYDKTGAQLGADLTLDLTKWTDIVVELWHDVTAGAGRVSIDYTQDASLGIYTSWIDKVAVTEQAAVAAGAIQWRVNPGSNASADLAYVGTKPVGVSVTYANPTDLAGGTLTAGHDIFMRSGTYIGGRNTGGVPGDTYTVSTTYSRGKEQLWRELRPSRYVSSGVDGVNWNTVLDAGANDLFRPEIVALFGTNVRQLTVSLNAADSWGAPSYSVVLDATVWSGSMTGGKGFIAPVDASVTFRPGRFRSDGDAHRWFLSAGGTVYEITDNDKTRIMVEGVDLGGVVATTCYVFCDRMAARVPPGLAHRYCQIKVTTAGDTSDGEYRIGTAILDAAFDLDTLYEQGFVDAIEPNVSVTEVDAGYRSMFRRGPRRRTFAVQWGPQNRPTSDFDLRVADFFAALEGGPFLLWRDTADPSSCGLYTFSGAVSMPNVLGEHEMALTRIDQLTLEEYW